jgi:hypothetical protein
MTPGAFTTPFYKGAAWEFSYLLKDGAGAPLDLTGLGPFYLDVANPETCATIATATGTGDYDSDGIVTFAFTKTQTRTFPIGTVIVSVRDSDDLPWMRGEPVVYKYPR